MENSPESAGIRIRDCTPDDRDGMLQCIRELQDAERTFDPRLLPGDRIAHSYLAELEANRAGWAGRLLVAQLDAPLLGFASIFTAGHSTPPTIQPARTRWGDLVVRARHRADAAARGRAHREGRRRARVARERTGGERIGESGVPRSRIRAVHRHAPQAAARGLRLAP